MSKRITIDPTKLVSDESSNKRDSKNESLRLGQLLEHLKSLGIDEINPNQEYPLVIQEGNKTIEVSIVLTHKLIFRPRMNPVTKKMEPRYSILSNKPIFGKGGFAGIYELEGSLIPQKNKRVRFKKGKPRLIKVQACNTPEDLAAVKKEAAISQLAKHLHAKMPTFIKGLNEKITSYMVLKKFPGLTLVDILEADKNNKHVLTVDQRIQLSINLLRALQEQVHDRGIVHRDIKPENIIVDLNTLEVNIIDFGMSRKSDKDDGFFGGSTKYAAPEALATSSTIDAASDRYSMAIVLGLLWRDKVRSNEFIKSLQSGEAVDYPFPALFSHISDTDIEKPHREQIGFILRKLTAYKKHARYSTEAAIDVFDAIKLQRKLTHVSKEQEVQISDAHRAAKKAATSLRGFVLHPAKTSLEKLQKCITDAVDSIVDTRAAAQEFVDTLGIKAFQHIEISKEAIKTTTVSIINQFIQHINNLLDLLDRVEKNIWLLAFDKSIANPKIYNKVISELSDFFEEIETVLVKDNKHEIRLDDCNELNQIFTRAEQKFGKELTAFADAVTDPDNNYPKSIQTYNYIMDQLAMSNEKSELTKRINAVKKEIKEYMHSTITPDNIEQSERGISEMRLGDVRQVLQLMKSADSPMELNQKVRAKLKAVKKGGVLKTGLFGRSKLCKHVEHGLSRPLPAIVTI